MTLRAIHGGCLIKPDVVVTEVGGIAVPDYIQKVGRPSGILLQAATDDKEILDCLGLRVLVRTAMAFEFDGERYLLAKINQLMAVVDVQGVIKLFDPIERCQWCKSAGEGNLLLDNGGYCIQCGRNKNGEHVSRKTLRVSDDEKEAFGHNEEYYLNRERPKGKVYSFSGQTKRSAAEVPPLKGSLGDRIDRLAEKSVPKTWIPKSDGKIISAASLKKRSRY